MAGDKEKGLNLPVTISFDRVQSTTAKIQAGFWQKFSIITSFYFKFFVIFLTSAKLFVD